MSNINPSQIEFARVRRRWTKAKLARELGVTSRSIQSYETGEHAPTEDNLLKLAQLLNFPLQFFYLEDSPSKINEHSASFRALSKLSESMKSCVLNAGAIAFKVNDWLEERFNLPRADLPDLSDLAPEEAAATLRRMWGLGSAPIPNMIHLLESKGIRVFSLAEETREVDAFCVWHEEKPFVFLNTSKSAERSRFDAAHELAHLVRDTYSMLHETSRDQDIERNADAFASAFLMPKESVIAHCPKNPTLSRLISLKQHWGVSLAALAYRYNSLGLFTEWTYRKICIDIARNGYRTTEPNPIEHETSQLLTKAFDFLSKNGITRKDIANDLHISIDEVNNLTFKLTKLSLLSRSNPRISLKSQAPRLKIVQA